MRPAIVADPPTLGYTLRLVIYIVFHRDKVLHEWKKLVRLIIIRYRHLIADTNRFIITPALRKLTLLP
jgi:hypothetical protein